MTKLCQPSAVIWCAGSHRICCGDSTDAAVAYVAIANRQAEIMMRIASEFGFTPASRGRLWMVSNILSGLQIWRGIEAAELRNGDPSQLAMPFSAMKAAAITGFASVFLVFQG